MALFCSCRCPLRKHFVPVKPCRVVDTRNATGPYGGPILSGGSSRNFTLPGVCGIPSSATALYSTQLYGGATNRDLATSQLGRPVNRNLMRRCLTLDGRVKANAAICAAVMLRCDFPWYATDNTHVVIDVDGYFCTGRGRVSANELAF